MRLPLPLSPRPVLLAALLGVAALSLASPALAAPGTLRDFRLPPDPDATSQAPAPQGPVAPDVPASTGVLRTPEPSPSAAVSPEPGPAPSASAVIQPLPVTTPAPRVSPPAAAPEARAPRPDVEATQASSAPAAVEDGEAPAGPATQGPDAALPAPAALPSATPLPVSADDGPAGWPWLWIAAALAALAGIAALVAVRRRRSSVPRSAPQIERPAPVPTRPESSAAAPEPASPLPAEPKPKPTPAALPVDGSSGLVLELEPLRLSLTLMNAALSYRLLLNNPGEEPLESLVIAADMIAAHAALSREQQLSGPGANAVQVASIDRLEAGERRVISGEFRLPFGQIVPIRQGNAALLFPLARFRIEGAGQEILTRTFLVAQPAERPGAGLRPFRLDLGPRVYPDLARQAFA